jgi:hypothetical protein
VTIEIICLRIARISDWISASGFVDVLDDKNRHSDVLGIHETTYGSCESASGSTNLMSNTQRSRGVRVSLDMMARTNCVTAPVRSHSAKICETGVGGLTRPTHSELA